MEKYFQHATIGHIGQNLLLLSLDVIRPQLALIKAPSLTDADYRVLRDWTKAWPSLEFFPYPDGTSFEDTIAVLNRALPAGRGNELLDWVLRSTPMTDPSRTDTEDRPARAANEWKDALDSAQRYNRLGALGLSDAGHQKLVAILRHFQERMQPAQAFAATLVKEWEPHPWEVYPASPGQWKYNLKAKSDWDRYVYETYCQQMSYALRFGVEFIVRDQLFHRFVRDYATGLTPADHEKISTFLPLVLEDQGHFAIYPWTLDQLRAYSDQPLESLLPYTREPL